MNVRRWLAVALVFLCIQGAAVFLLAVQEQKNHPPSSQGSQK